MPLQTDETQPSVTGEKHPTLAELKNPSHPEIGAHISACSMCASIVSASADGNDSSPIVLDLPKGLVDETAFRWPADPVAQGGMAQIFAGQDKRLGRTVILKAPRDGDELSAGMAELFQQRVTAEAKILAKLQHPSIVTIYELGKSTVGWPFCVMEQVDGVPLREKLDELAEREKTEGKPCTRERLDLLSSLVSVAEALAYAHEKRVVHRDCTPNNILLGKRGEATLIDWGIARDLDAPGGSTEAKLTRDDDPGASSGKMVTISAGTPPYLPLEQTQGRRADPSFDVYSFGVTLYETVAGVTPFEWKSGLDRTRQLEDFLDWVKVGETVAPAMPRDPELSGIIARAMAHAPGDRFTADELVRALKQYLTGDLVFSHRYSATGRLARWMRRNRAITVAVSALLVFAIAGALVWIQMSRARAQRAELESAAAAARVDASEKGREADAASLDADQARARADQAEREGKDAKALRDDADKKRRAAEKLKADSQSAAARAKGDADEAIKRFQEAMKAKEVADAAAEVATTERDAARAAQANAEKTREEARSAQAVSERAREDARAAQANAEKSRDDAQKAQSAAERARDDAQKAQSTAEKDRDAARAAETAADKERDDARRRAAEFEARLKALESAPRPPPPAPSGSGSATP